MSLRKIALSTLSLVVVAAMSACSNSTMTSPVASVKATSDLSFASNMKPGTFDPITNSTFVADIGSGKKGANINFTMKDSSSFNTKANGAPQGLFGNIVSVQLQLRDLVPSPIFTSGQIVTTGGTAFTGGAGTGTRTFNIANVPPGSYTVTVMNALNATGFNILKAQVTSGTIVINSDNQITSPLTNSNVAIALTDGLRASIDSTVTSTDGTPLPAPGITAS